jgi:uncharacterized membrane protein YbhN (UPF0104 family)
VIRRLDNRARKVISAALFRGLLALLLLTAVLAIMAIVEGRMPKLTSESLGFLAAGLGLSILQEFAGALAAWTCLASTGARVHILRLLLITTASTSLNSSIPAPAGIPIRLFLQKKFLGIEAANSTAALLIESAVGYGMLFAFAAASPLILPSLRIGSNSPSYDFLRLGLLLAIPILMAVGFAVSGKARRFAIEALMAVRKALAARNPFVLLSIAITAVCYPLALARLHFALRAIGADCPAANLLVALVLSRTAGVLSMIPMGLVVRDLSLAGILRLSGVSSTAAVSASVLDRLLMTLPYLFGGILAAFFFARWESSGPLPVLAQKNPSVEAESDSPAQ